jgi:4'-phosphopantetheinyl transferase
VTLLALALRPVRAADAGLAGLDPRERALVPPRATEKRRAEFTAGRGAARRALARLLGPRAEGAAVVPEAGPAGGRPVVIGGDGARLAVHVSITHAGGLAAAVAGPSPLGLDLVSLEPLDEAFREEAFVEEELAGWAAWAGLRGVAAGADAAACLAFAAKEAALKWLGTGLGLPLQAVRVAPAGPGAPARLGGVAALAAPVRVETERGTALLEGWVAGSRRRVLVVVSGGAGSA